MIELRLIRHGETEWSRDQRHTGREDIPLLEEGREAARAVGPRLADRPGDLVLCSPLRRAVQTAEEAGLSDRMERVDDLMEWDYGDYEGITRFQVRETRPDWDLWRDGCPGGETAADVGARADRVLALVATRDRDAILVAHGHLLRILTARWLGLAPEAGALFALSPASLSVLMHERGRQVLGLWNSVEPRPADG